MSAVVKELLAKKCVQPKDVENYVTTSASLTHGYSLLDVLAPWWWVRERLRETYEVYGKPTEVLSAVRTAYPDTFVHVSRDDPKMVAYTPGASQGEADVQVKTTLGRYLVKFFPTLPQSRVQELVYEHESEADPYIEMLSGAAIEEVYRSGAFNTCMSSTGKTWPTLPDGLHPALVYDAPNIHLAVMRNSGGAVAERALIFTDAKGVQKFIRCYGNKLQKKLHRNNIKSGNFIGATFKTVLFDEDRNIVTEPVVGATYRVVVPYMDSNGSTASTEGSTVALVDGKLICIGQRLGTKLRAHRSDGSTTASNTSGYVVLYNHPSTALYATCLISGKQINVEADAYVNYIRADGVEGQALDSELTADMSWLYAPDSGGSFRRCYVAAGVPTFTHKSWGDVPDFDHFRSRAGYSKLDSDRYPETGWVATDLTRVVDDKRVLKSDLVVVLTLNAADNRYVESYLWKPARKDLKAYTKLHPRTKGEKLYAAAGSTIVTTVSGKQVIQDVHDPMRLWDGRFELSRKVTQVRYMRRNWWVLKPITPLTGADKARMQEVWVAEHGYTDDWATEANQRDIQDFITSFLQAVGDNYSYGSYLGYITDYRLGDIAAGTLMASYPALQRIVKLWWDANQPAEVAAVNAQDTITVAAVNDERTALIG